MGNGLNRVRGTKHKKTDGIIPYAHGRSGIFANVRYGSFREGTMKTYLFICLSYLFGVLVGKLIQRVYGDKS